jgi:CspA family cold shock protein
MNDHRSTQGTVSPLLPANDDQAPPRLGQGTGKEFVARLDLATAQNRLLAMVVASTTTHHQAEEAAERYAALDDAWNSNPDPDTDTMPADGAVYECCGFITHFDVSAGFGFITPDNGLPQAALHASTLKVSGLSAAPRGARIMCQIVETASGFRVHRVYRIDARCATPPSKLDCEEIYPAEAESSWVEATIMRFDFVKGHGYLTVPSQNVTVYCQAETVRRFGFFQMRPGQEVQIRWGQTARGPTVAELRMIEDFPL